MAFSGTDEQTTNNVVFSGMVSDLYALFVCLSVCLSLLFVLFCFVFKYKKSPFLTYSVD